MKIKVGVIFGGETVEHEVSIISAVQAMNSMNEEKYDIIPIYIAKDRTWYTGKMLMDIELYKDFEDLKRYAKKVTLCKKDGKYYLVNTTGILRHDVTELDIAFPIVHGNNAEDGSIQGFLDSIGIPYVGSRVLGSALGQDKVVMKQIFESCKLPIVKYTWFFDNEYLEDSTKIQKEIKKLGYPVVVKPATLGSSVGITYVKKEEEIDAAVTEAIKYDSKIVVEKAVENLVEVNCSVLGNYESQEVSEIEEVMSTEEFLTYRDKYLGNAKGSKSKGMASTNRVIPARISKELYEEVQNISKSVFKVLNLSGVCRIDFLINSKTKELFINEPNTIPGSLSFYLWEPVGKKYSELLDDMITLAIKDYKNRSKKVYSFETNILQNFNGLKGSKGVKNKLK